MRLMKNGKQQSENLKRYLSMILKFGRSDCYNIWMR